MKKLWVMFLSLVVMMTMMVPVNAFNETTMNDSYTSLKTFYQTKGTLESPDDIIAAESLGLEAEEGFEVVDLVNQDFKNLSIGDLTKSLIALTLMGKDPRNINNTNLVELVEGYVNSDGSINTSTGCNVDVWVLFALEVVNSDKVESVADHLSTLNNNEGNEGAFWYAGPWYSEDVTGWAIEALSIANKDKYEESIERSLNYLSNSQKDDASYGNINGDTQACVLEGLIAYDKDGVKNGTYNKGDNHPLDVLLSFQLDDGSFKSVEYDANWQPTGNYIYNSYTTIEAARTIGAYYNDSFVLKARTNFEALSIQQPTVQQPTQQPAQKAESTVKPVENEKVESVKTGDDQSMMLYAILMLLSLGGLYVRHNEKVER